MNYFFKNINRRIIILFFLSFFLSHLLHPSFLSASSDKTYNNPVITSGQCPDPTIWKGDNGYFYATGTNFIKNTQIFKSLDLVNWELCRNNALLTSKVQENLLEFGKNKGYKKKDANGMWAPHVVKIGKQYVLYASIENRGGIFVLTSPSPYGPFDITEKSSPLLWTTEQANMPYDVIDPYVVKDHDGKWYMFYGSAYGIYRVELNADGLSVKTNVKPVHIAGKYISPQEKVTDKKREWTVEGSALFYKDNYWYYFGSKGGTNGASYRVVVGRSKKLKEDFVDKEGKLLKEGFGTVILRSTPYLIGTGGSSEIITDNEGKTFICYHARLLPNNGKGVSPMRYLCLSELKWDKDGWPYVEHGRPQELLNPSPVFSNNEAEKSNLNQLKSANSIEKRLSDSIVTMNLDVIRKAQLKTTGDLSILDGKDKIKEKTIVGDQKIRLDKVAGSIYLDDWKSLQRIRCYEKKPTGLIFNLEMVKESPLTNFSLLNCRIYGDLSIFKDKTQLTYLLLHKSPDVYGDIKNLQKCILLKELNLAYTSCNGDFQSIAHLKNLEFLDISNTLGYITGDFSLIANLPKLEYLGCLNTGNLISWSSKNLRKSGTIIAVNGCFDSKASVLNYLNNMLYLTPSKRYRTITIYCTEKVDIPANVKDKFKELGYSIKVVEYTPTWNLP